MNQETKTLKLLPGSVKNEIAKQSLFGWKVEQQEELREMKGLNDYIDYVKVYFVRKGNNEKLKELEQEYIELEDKLEKLKYDLNNHSSKRPIEPVWKDVKTKSTDLGNGSSWVTETTTYYGGYTYTHWFWGILLFTPIMPIALIYLIVKLVKKTKCKKQFKLALKEYDKKYSEYLKEDENIRKEKNRLVNRLEKIIVEINELK